MTTHPSQRPDPSDRRKPRKGAARKRRRRRAARAAAQTLTAQQLDELWAAYMANRDDLQLRNRLVEHYYPWFRELAAAIAHKLKLRDQANAVGEALVALVTTIVPGYDGQSGFVRWARVCARRRLVNLQRDEQLRRSIFADEPHGARQGFMPDILPDREQPGFDLNFLKLTANLSDRNAALLWLRYYRGMSVKAVAVLLNVSPWAVSNLTHRSLAQLKKSLTQDAFPVY